MEPFKSEFGCVWACTIKLKIVTVSILPELINKADSTSRLHTFREQSAHPQLEFRIMVLSSQSPGRLLVPTDVVSTIRSVLKSQGSLKSPLCRSLAGGSFT